MSPLSSAAGRRRRAPACSFCWWSSAASLCSRSPPAATSHRRSPGAIVLAGAMAGAFRPPTIVSAGGIRRPLADSAASSAGARLLPSCHRRTVCQGGVRSAADFRQGRRAGRHSLRAHRCRRVDRKQGGAADGSECAPHRPPPTVSPRPWTSRRTSCVGPEHLPTNVGGSGWADGRSNRRHPCATRGDRRMSEFRLRIGRRIGRWAPRGQLHEAADLCGPLARPARGSAAGSPESAHGQRKALPQRLSAGPTGGAQGEPTRQRGCPIDRGLITEGSRSLLTAIHPLVMTRAVATPVGGRPVARSHLFLIYPSIVSTNAVDDRGRGVDGSGGPRFHRGFVLPVLKLAAVALATGGLLLLAGQAAAAEEPSTDPVTATTSVEPEFTGVDLAPAEAGTDGTRMRRRHRWHADRRRADGRGVGVHRG